MKRRTLALLLSGLLALSLCACGGVEQTPLQEEGTPPDLTGTWTVVGSDAEEDEGAAIATITDSEIEIVFNIDDMGEFVYWSGSFVAPTDSTEPYTWTSAGNTDVMSGSLLGSQDDEKVFSYENGILSFEFTMQGETGTVKMEKAPVKADDGKSDDDKPASSGKLGDYEVSIGDCSFGTDYEGNKLIIINYDFTNNSDETSSPDINIYFEAFQDGVQLESGYGDDVDYGIGQKQIRPGVSLEGCQTAFVLTSDSTVEVEASYSWDFDDDYLYKTFEVTQ